MHLRTAAGMVELAVWRGQDPADQHWGIPIREVWGLTAHQEMSPGLEDKLAFTATLANSYEAAAELTGKWGCPVAASVIHALVQRLGHKAQRQSHRRWSQPPPPESQPPRRASELAVLMIDGWFARFRGPGWGQKRTEQERVEWREIKTGVFYLHEQAGRTAGGRGVIVDKRVVRWQGEPLELGRRLNGEALRGGLARAEHQLLLADGVPWIWKLKEDRWAEAMELLDFWHASQHVWELGRALHGDEEAQVKRWVELRLHRLRHGQEQAVLKEIAALRAPRGEAGETVRRQQNYFASHAGRMNYQTMAKRQWPIGSGPVESTCRQDQGRFKGCGQFWRQPGFAHLSALDEARHNHHWDELWLAA